MSASDSESDDEIYENVAAVLEARKASLEQDSSDDDYEGPVAVPPRRKTIVVRIILIIHVSSLLSGQS